MFPSETLHKVIEQKEQYERITFAFNINKKDVLKYEPGYPQGAPLRRGAPCGYPANEYEYSVIANIPYYITSPILRHFLYTVKNKPNKMVILMQEEVGDKIM